MKVKLDENLAGQLAAVLIQDGHNADTVPAERLSGSSDEKIFEACRATGRTLITLDLDFANPFRFPPGDTEGIVVIRPPRPLLSAIRATLLSVLGEFKTKSLRGQLWIVEPGRIRVHVPDDHQ